jgi:hypothetical protein
MIALDISGSMWGGWGGNVVAGIPGFTAAQAAGVMSMVSLKTGDPCEVVCFASGVAAVRRTARGSGPGTELIPGLRPLGCRRVSGSMTWTA